MHDRRRYLVGQASDRPYERWKEIEPLLERKKNENIKEVLRKLIYVKRNRPRIMEIDIWQLNNIVKAAAEEAVKKYIISLEPSKDEITERQAYKEFGRGWVCGQVALGLVKPTRRGTSKNSPKVYLRSVLKELKEGVNPLLKAVVS